MDRFIALVVFAGAAVAAAPAPSAKQTTITGVVSDDMCATAGHASMRMGPTDAECTLACVDAHGAQLVLVAGRDVYTLSDQELPKKFAGQRVRVTGTIEEVKSGRIFHVKSIVQAK
jgi:Protein of unknown function (DUF5818)